jgi:hypothetical protein
VTRDLVYLVFFLMLCLDAHAADWDSHGTFKTSGGELHYRVSGVGKPLLLLHDYCDMVIRDTANSGRVFLTNSSMITG